MISFTAQSKEPKVLAQQFLLHKNFKSFEDSVRYFLKENVPKDCWPEVANIGIAGAIHNNRITLTNYKDWPPIDGDEIAKNLGIAKLNLYNDFEIASYGVLNLENKDLVPLTSATVSKN